MSDPTNLERYCSSYYDRHGLYNDGFPCPTDKYCCQSADGAKMCCSLSNDLLFKQKLTTSSSSPISYYQQTVQQSTLLNKLNKHKLSSPLDVSSSSSSTTLNSLTISSYWPFIVSNSTLLMSICIALGLLVLLSIVLLIFVCKRCNYNNNNNNSKSKKRVKNNNNNNSSSISPYSRNSSSSCTSTTVTSSTSTSPKTNEITVCCGVEEEENDEHQKILTIDPTSVSNSSGSSTINSNVRNNMMLSNRSSNLSDLMSQRNTFNQNQFHQTFLNAFSNSSSSSAALLLNNNNSHNTTHSSFSSGSNTNFGLQNQHNFNNINNNDNNNNNNNNNMQFDEQDENEDFIVTTSSNLEFLKSQSLFNSTPLNYYPTLSMTSNLKPLLTETNQVQLQPICNNSGPIAASPAAISTTKLGSQMNLTSAATSNNLGEFRFSTFLPTIYTKHHELI